MSELITFSLDEVSDEPPEWIWPHRIPRNKVTVVNGDYSVGKTRSIIKVLSHVFNNEVFPDGEMPGTGTGHVVFITTETSPGRLKDMCRAQGIPEEYIGYFKGIRGSYRDTDKQELMLDLDSDLVKIKKFINQHQPLLAVVVDPLVEFHHRNEVNSHEIRGLMVQLDKLCQQYNCALISMIHWNKNEKGSMRTRMSGSHQYGAAVTNVITVYKHPKQKDVSVLHQDKNNLSHSPDDILFSIEKPDGMVVWINPSELPKDTKAAECAKWLKELTADGPVMLQSLREMGVYPIQTIYNAKALLGDDLRVLSLYSEEKGRRMDHWEYAYFPNGTFKLLFS